MLKPKEWRKCYQGNKNRDKGVETVQGESDTDKKPQDAQRGKNVGGWNWGKARDCISNWLPGDVAENQWRSSVLDTRMRKTVLWQEDAPARRAISGCCWAILESGHQRGRGGGRKLCKTCQPRARTTRSNVLSSAPPHYSVSISNNSVCICSHH